MILNYETAVVVVVVISFSFLKSNFFYSMKIIDEWFRQPMQIWILTRKPVCYLFMIQSHLKKSNLKNKIKIWSKYKRLTEFIQI